WGPWARRSWRTWSWRSRSRTWSCRPWASSRTWAWPLEPWPLEPWSLESRPWTWTWSLVAWSLVRLRCRRVLGLDPVRLSVDLLLTDTHERLCIHHGLRTNSPGVVLFGKMTGR